METITTPEALLSDPNSKVFYILRDETIAICKSKHELPYHKKRETYLSCGRFSPEHKKVIFWPAPINPGKAFQLLVENMHITDDFVYFVSGSAKIVKKTTSKNNPLSKLSGVKKRSVEVLMDKGMRIQGHDNENNSA